MVGDGMQWVGRGDIRVGDWWTLREALARNKQRYSWERNIAMKTEVLHGRFFSAA